MTYKITFKFIGAINLQINGCINLIRTKLAATKFEFLMYNLIIGG